MKKILKDKEIDNILNIRENLQGNLYKNIYDEIKKQIKDFNYNSNDNNIRNKLIIECILTGIFKKHKNTIKCPFCNGNYVVKRLYGDVFFRQGKDEEIKDYVYETKFFKNISPYAMEDDEKQYECLNCGKKW